MEVDDIRYCCLRRDNRECAFLLSSENSMTGRIRLRLGNIFDGITAEYKEYTSVDELLNDNWYVD